MTEHNPLTPQEQRDAELEPGGKLSSCGAMRYRGAKELIRHHMPSFLIVADCLANIRYFKWYLADGHATFTAFLQGEYGWKPDYARKVIRAVLVGAALASEEVRRDNWTLGGKLPDDREEPQNDTVVSVTQADDVTERQLRPLTRGNLRADEVRSIWALGEEIADGMARKMDAPPERKVG